MRLTKFQLATFAFCVLIVTACSSDEEMNGLASSIESNAICFKVQTPNLTRAVDSYNNNSRPTRFKVTAYQGDSNYYGGAVDEMASADGGNSWTSSHERFWPTASATGKSSLTFYAFIEHNDMDACTAFGKHHSFDMTGDVPQFKDFKVNTDVAQQNDLMYAVAKEVSKTSTLQGSVTLNFRHALSQVCFTAQNNDPTLSDIEILAIEVGGIKGTGSYRFPNHTTSTLSSDSENRIAMGEWNINSNSELQSYKLTGLSERLGAPDATGHGDVKNISIPESGVNRNDGKSIDISRSMYLIPQKAKACTSESANDGAYFKVTINVGTTRSSDPITLFVPVSIDWKEGHRYVYNLTWEGTAIKYAVNIADYQDVNI